jgi:hypothetical protein
MTDPHADLRTVYWEDDVERIAGNFGISTHRRGGES